MRASSAASFWTARAVLFLGLAWWLRASWALLPYNYLDLAYLFSLEQGFVLAQVWVHPLFMPLLQALSALLRLCGHGGHMLLPLELINMTLGAATISGLYAVLERRGCEPLRCAGLLLALAFSHGFWEGVLRPTPYALAAAASAASLLALTDLPARVGLAGALAGAAAGLHLSALALLPTGWLCLEKERRLRFASGFALALAGSYAVLLRSAPAELLRLPGAGKLFSGVEQMPHSSLYTNPHPWAQAQAYFATLERHGGQAGLLILAAALAGLFWARRRWIPELRAGWLAALAFAGFFYVNNSQNGFAFSSVLALAPAAAAAPFPAQVSLAVGGAGAALAAASAVKGLGDGAAQDAQFVESRFISGLIGPRGLLAVPGCPPAELFYEQTFPVLDMGPGPSQDFCLAPYSAAPAPRLGRALAAGRRAFVSFGDVKTDFQGEFAGVQKLHQVFVTPLLQARERAAFASVRRAELEKSFRLEGPTRSPAGREYWELKSKGRLPKAPAAPAWDPAPLLAWSANQRDPGLRAGLAYLAAWLASAPEDQDARSDLSDLFARKLADRADQPDAVESASLFDQLAGLPAGTTLRRAHN